MLASRRPNRDHLCPGSGNAEYRRLGGWVGDMDNYCSHTLTVERVVNVVDTNNKTETHVYVEENCWRWKAAFIAEVITKEEYEPIPFESLDSLLFGGA